MSTSLCKTSVLRIYNEVIDDVIIGVRDLFVEDGVDDQVLQDLKQTWETKLMNSKAIQNEQEEKKKPEVQTTNGFPKVQNNPIQSNIPTHQVPQQIAPHTQHIVEAKQVPIQITLPQQPGSDGPRILTIQVPSTALQGNQLQRVLTGPVITATMGLPVNIASSLLQQHVNAALNSQAQAHQQTVTIVNKNVAQADGAADDEEQVDTSRDHDHLLARNDKILNEHLMETDNIKNNYRGVDLNKPISIEVIMNSHRRKGFRTARRGKKRDTTMDQADGPADTSDDEDDGSDDEADADDDLDDDDKDGDDEEMEEEGGEEEPLNSEDDVTDDDPSDLFDTDNIVVCQYDKIIRNRNKWKFYLKDGIMNLNGQDYVFQKATGDAEW